jgi:hypothetical protein
MGPRVREVEPRGTTTVEAYSRCALLSQGQGIGQDLLVIEGQGGGQL